MGEFYSVKTMDIKSFDRIPMKNYNLRVLDSRVFFAGFIFRNSNDSFWNENILIDDYTLKVGDTMLINFNSVADTMHVIIDSLSTIQTRDGKTRKIQYCQQFGNRGLTRTFNNSSSSNIMGLGGSSGLLPYIQNYLQFKTLVSVCKSNAPIYINDSFIHYFENELKRYDKEFGQTILNAPCDKASLENMIIAIDKLDIATKAKPSFDIYPNPAQNSISIDWKSIDKPLNIVVTDLHGKNVFQQHCDSKETLNLPTENWSNGIYIIRVFTKDNSSSIIKKVMINR